MVRTEGMAHPGTRSAHQGHQVMKTRGLTLIELLIMVAIVGIIIAAVVPLLTRDETQPVPVKTGEQLITPTPVPATPASR